MGGDKASSDIRQHDKRQVFPVVVVVVVVVVSPIPISRAECRCKVAQLVTDTGERNLGLGLEFTHE